MSIKKDILWRIWLAFFAVCLLAIAVMYKAGNTYIAEGKELRALSDSITTQYKPIEAERGNILSEDGRLLATSLPFFEVRLDLKADGLTKDVFKENVERLAMKMALKFKDKSAQRYKEDLILARRENNRYYLIRKNVTYPDLQEMKTWPILKLGRYKGGLLVIQNNKRVLPFRDLAQRTIGYTRDSMKSIGLEARYDSILSGVKGKRLMQKIAGAELPVNEEDEIRAEDGKDIITTLDINLQDVLESALMKAVVNNNADHGCAILMEVSTGKIKAIANIGQKNGQFWENYNYAVGESTEPGSTFKLASLIALLEDGHVKMSDHVDIADGKTTFYDKTMYDSEKHDIENVTVQHAFELSSNVGISKLVNHYYMGEPEKYTAHLQKLGLYDKTNVGISGEPSPYIKQPDQTSWSGVTLPWMSVGYELTMTPLQMLAFYNAIANDGYRVKPYLVKEVQKMGQTVKSFGPEVSKERICSESTLKKVKAALEGVVSNGTAKNLESQVYKIAGKTGTARIAKEGRYDKVYQASFAGYFPADNPAYSCIVVINTPKNGLYYGGAVAGPVFREVADKIYATSLALHNKVNTRSKFPAINTPGLIAGNRADIEKLCKQFGININLLTDANWVSGEPQNEGIAIKEKPVLDGQVPNVLGMGLKDALYLLENHGLMVDFKGKGKVKQQSLSPGTIIARGQTIYIELS